LAGDWEFYAFGDETSLFGGLQDDGEASGDREDSLHLVGLKLSYKPILTSSLDLEGDVLG